MYTKMEGWGYKMSNDCGIQFHTQARLLHLHVSMLHIVLTPRKLVNHSHMSTNRMKTCINIEMNVLQAT